MRDAAVEKADRIEAGVLRELERLYPAALSPLMEKHKATFARLDKLEKEGAYGRARILLRRSGLVEDVARALAGAGVRAADLIRAEIAGVKEAVADDDTEKSI